MYSSGFQIALLAITCCRVEAIQRRHGIVRPSQDHQQQSADAAKFHRHKTAEDTPPQNAAAPHPLHRLESLDHALHHTRPSHLPHTSGHPQGPRSPLLQRSGAAQEAGSSLRNHVNPVITSAGDIGQYRDPKMIVGMTRAPSAAHGDLGVSALEIEGSGNLLPADEAPTPAPTPDPTPGPAQALQVIASLVPQELQILQATEGPDPTFGSLPSESLAHLAQVPTTPALGMTTAAAVAMTTAAATMTTVAAGVAAAAPEATPAAGAATPAAGGAAAASADEGTGMGTIMLYLMMGGVLMGGGLVAYMKFATKKPQAGRLGGIAMDAEDSQFMQSAKSRQHYRVKRTSLMTSNSDSDTGAEGTQSSTAAAQSSQLFEAAPSDGADKARASVSAPPPRSSVLKSTRDRNASRERSTAEGGTGGPRSASRSRRPKAAVVEEPES